MRNCWLFKSKVKKFRENSAARLYTIDPFTKTRHYHNHVDGVDFLCQEDQNWAFVRWNLSKPMQVNGLVVYRTDNNQVFYSDDFGELGVGKLERTSVGMPLTSWIKRFERAIVEE